MKEEQAAMMMQIQQLGLTMDDLAIYLDMHMYDNFALERYHQTASAYRNLLNEYAIQYGPLLQMDNAMGGTDFCSWLWAEQDFPWDY